MVTAVKTATADIRVGEDGLLHALVRSDGHHTIEAAEENITAFRTLNEPDCSRPVLIDCRALNAPMDRAARQYYANGYARGRIRAVAVLLGSAASRVVGTFLTASDREGPMRVFTDEDEAIAWLKTFIVPP